MKIDRFLRYEPERVISIVSPSRSGSTVIKYAIQMHPDLCSLAGEEEPYYKLAGNGYPWHESDRFTEPNQPELVRNLIANELFNYNSFYNRAHMQQNHIEEPPFVEAKECRRTPILLLKTPQNCYRRGVLEALYPNARITYIRVYRDPRAIVNGLIDGWERDGMFEARLAHGQWWKFDMPPGWEKYAYESDEDKAIFQCRSSILYLNTEYPDAMGVSFERFCDDWRAATYQIWARLGLPQTNVLTYAKLPVLMATDSPEPDRWRAKRPHLEGLKI